MSVAYNTEGYYPDEVPDFEPEYSPHEAVPLPDTVFYRQYSEYAAPILKMVPATCDYLIPQINEAPFNFFEGLHSWLNAGKQLCDFIEERKSGCTVEFLEYLEEISPFVLALAKQIVEQPNKTRVPDLRLVPSD